MSRRWDTRPLSGPPSPWGGTGGGIAYNAEEFEHLAKRGLDLSPAHEILIEESVIGWKEFELEVMRDLKDNVVVICSIENFDPMGVHTGDSITVAPVQTLTDKEYQFMRNAAMRIIRKVGVETGGSNIQFAVNPRDGRLVVIEMNPRVSRSSALASKATGFPIAKIAAKLAVGLTLDEIPNDITLKTPACFEPTIDYVVTKIPKWAFEKFPEAEPLLGTQMKSVGEVMAIGRTFKESLLKALRSLETGRKVGSQKLEPDRIRERLIVPNPDRLLYLRFAFERGLSVEEAYQYTQIDPWFLRQVREVSQLSTGLRGAELAEISPLQLRQAKRLGFSDQYLAWLTGSSAAEVHQRRQGLKLRPVYKRVDTCAAEFESFTALPLFHLRAAVRGRTFRETEDRDPGQRSQSDRPGHRVRLLLLPRLLRPQGRRLRDDHGELQSRDRLHRLRHFRSTLLRAADL